MKTLALVSLGAGFAAGYLHYRRQLLAALRAGAVRHPARTFDVEPIDSDAWLRIVKSS